MISFFLMYYQQPQCSPILCVSLCLVLSSSTAHRFSLHELEIGSLITLIHAFQLCIPKDNPPFFFQPWVNKVLGKSVEWPSVGYRTERWADRHGWHSVVLVIDWVCVTCPTQSLLTHPEWTENIHRRKRSSERRKKNCTFSLYEILYVEEFIPRY